MAEPLDVRSLIEAARPARDRGPWKPEDFVRLVSANAVGLILVFASWFQTTQAADVRGRLTWLNLALVGLVIAGAGNGMWLLRGRQVVGLARVAMLPQTSHAPGATAVFEPGANGSGPSANGSSFPVAVAGTAHYHRPSCMFVAGRDVTAASPRDHEREGRSPCGVCEP